MTNSSGPGSQQSRSPMTAGQTTEDPLISVVVPARNEADAIGDAIASVAAQDYPADRVELLIVDGGSTDGTATVAREIAAPLVFAAFEVIDNPVGTTPSNLNAGLKHAKGDLVVRLDARARLPRRYLSRCAELLTGNVAVVGGRQVAISNGHSLVARGIARALNNRHAMGGAAYRSAGSASGPVDTVYLGAFRRDDLEAVGGWSTEMASNQDYELNQRISRMLAKPVWFASDLEVHYIGRATLAEIGRQYHRFGRWKVRYWRRNDQKPQPRQILLLIAPPVGGILAAATALTLGPRRWPALAVSAIGGLFVVDEVGTSKSPVADKRDSTDGTGPWIRLVAVATMALVGSGWWSGVAREFLCGSNRSEVGR